jgi:hypothetical protein
VIALHGPDCAAPRPCMTSAVQILLSISLRLAVHRDVPIATRYTAPTSYSCLLAQPTGSAQLGAERSTAHAGQRRARPRAPHRKEVLPGTPTAARRPFG